MADVVEEVHVYRSGERLVGRVEFDPRFESSMTELQARDFMAQVVDAERKRTWGSFKPVWRSFRVDDRQPGRWTFSVETKETD